MCESGLNDSVSYAFELQLDGSDEKICILLNTGTYIYFLGYGISHRQVSLNVDGEKHVHHDFWNVSSYANKHLFDNVMASFRRCGDVYS